MKGVKLTSKEHVSKQEWHVPLLSFTIYDVFNCRKWCWNRQLQKLVSSSKIYCGNRINICSCRENIKYQ